MNLWLPKGNGVGRDKLKDWDQNIYTSVYKVNNYLLDSTENSTQYSGMIYMEK